LGNLNLYTSKKRQKEVTRLLILEAEAATLAVRAVVGVWVVHEEALQEAVQKEG
jgi:hypothetical protein